MTTQPKRADENHRFEKGQQVTCISASRGLLVGAVYTVLDSGSGALNVDGLYGPDWHLKNSFEPLDTPQEAKAPCLWGFHSFDGKDSCQECGWLYSEIEAMGAIENDRRRSQPQPPQQPSVVITCVGPCRNIDHRSGCCSLCGKEYVEPAPVQPDKYAEHRSKLERHGITEATMAAKMNTRVSELSARERNIAALRAEQSASDRKAGLLELRHPLGHWSGRNGGRR